MRKYLAELSYEYERSLTFSLTIDFNKIVLQVLELGLTKQLKISEPVDKWSTFAHIVVRGDGIIILS